MRLLRVTAAGEKAQQVELRGDPRNPEPDHFRVVFPGGDVDLARCDDGSYWIHVRVDRPRDGGDDGDEGIIQVDYRINGCECHCCFYEWQEQCCHEVVTVAGEVAR